MARVLTSLRIDDYSDRELLLIVRDLGKTDPDQWVLSIDIAERLGIESQRPKQVVGSRMSWLQRYGALEREHLRDEYGNLRFKTNGKPVYAQRWRLTERGKELAVGKLTKRDQDQLAKVTSDERLLLVTRFLTQRQRATDDTARTLMRREWRYGTSPLRELNGNGNGFNGTGG